MNTDKKRVLVDMDGVLADVYQQFIRYEKEETGKEIKLEDAVGNDEVAAFPNGLKHVNMKGFFRTVPVMKDAVEGMKYLNEKYEVFIVSAAMEFPNSLQDKYEWLQEFFPFLTWKQFIFCGSKVPVCADVMIDDHPKNLDYFSGKRIIFSQLHNAGKDNHYTRMNSWSEIYEIL